MFVGFELYYEFHFRLHRIIQSSNDCCIQLHFYYIFINNNNNNKTHKHKIIQRKSIMEHKELFEQWKATAKYSSQYTQRMAEEAKFAESAEKFFAEPSPLFRKPEPKKEELAATYLKQLKMEVKTPDLPNPYEDPKAEKLTTTAYNNMIVGQSLKKMTETTGMPPKLTTTSGEDMNLILRQGNDVWRRQTYTDPEYRADLLKSTNRAIHDQYFCWLICQNSDPEVAKSLNTNKFNMRKTVISEYSNALHNKRVFTNPTFSSCQYQCQRTDQN
eukprot:TRINITY_DN416_c0_g2_i1.p2 TRINITY_DN416_c0_g2~~TRINITY_DN416_c0_g2_i1.p2  ORF type:complete len:272 (+),score=15.55 TRINITY_DN416_c0_g2_i1:2212-3027(+)